MRYFLLCCLLLRCIVSDAQTPGCTDPLATNYNAAATVNDGSCTYAVTGVTPFYSDTLQPAVFETSGLLHWNNLLWTHNDDTDTLLYSIDPAADTIAFTTPLPGVHNTDWEELAQDSLYFYIGDFGNNVNGARTDLHILRIAKDSLLSGNPHIDTIYFTYSDQVNVMPAPSDSTRFDCEAMLVTTDSIFLFTKQWTTYRTSYYALPKIPGTYTAQLRDSLNVAGLVTGATYLADKKLVALCGYNGLLQPFLYLLYDFNGTDFFGGNKRRLSLSLPFHQVEAISSNDGLNYVLTNERTVIGNINTPEKIHRFDLSSLVQPYFSQLNSISGTAPSSRFLIYPNPFTDVLHIRGSAPMPEAVLTINDVTGRTLYKLPYRNFMTVTGLNTLPAGAYLLRITAVADGGLLFSQRVVKP
jgi:hypothetical protein